MGRSIKLIYSSNVTHCTEVNLLVLKCCASYVLKKLNHVNCKGETHLSSDFSLPVPWLMYTLLHNSEPVAVSSNGLFCAIVLLFLMLLFVIMSIAACRWKMSRKLGLTMFVLYFVFLVLSVLLEDRILVCPVSIWDVRPEQTALLHLIYTQTGAILCLGCVIYCRSAELAHSRNIRNHITSSWVNGKIHRASISLPAVALWYICCN